jgi:hypothetical protein
MQPDATEERIASASGVSTHCKLCGGEFAKNAFISGNMHAGVNSDCFLFNFWAEKYVWHLRGDLVVPTPMFSSLMLRQPAPQTRQLALRIGHIHYAVVNALVPKHSGFMGFGGATMYADVFNGPHHGTLVAANDWWCQGDIPPEWQLMLPDNARFIEKEEYDRAESRNQD